MKKITVTVFAALFLLTFSSIQAQTTMSFGGNGGLNISNATFNPDLPTNQSKSSRTGFRIGGVAEFSFIPMLALQVEPTFLTGGTQVSGPLFYDANTGQIVNGNITYKTTYFQLPILLKFKVPVAGPVSPYVLAGPNLGFIMSAKELDEPSGGYQSSESDFKDQLKTLDFALNFGAGVGFSVVPGTTITVDFRYSLGLSDISSDKGKQQNGGRSIKTTGFQILAGVLFGI